MSEGQLIEQRNLLPVDEEWFAVVRIASCAFDVGVLASFFIPLNCKRFCWCSTS